MPSLQYQVHKLSYACIITATVLVKFAILGNRGVA